MAEVRLTALPFPLHPVGGDGGRTADAGRLTISAPARSDWFVPPGGGPATSNAPALVGDVDGDYTLSARVTVDFRGTFDAGALVLYASPLCWAKLAFEYSPQRQPMIVSVVTRDRSDDANGFLVDERSVWLRVAQLGAELAFHASTDGAYWHLVRHFSLGEDVAASVGFEAQAPTGDGCTAVFDEIAFAARRLDDLRDGT